MFKIFKKKKKEKGFTLIETLIAISILMISVAAPLSLAAKGIQAASLAKQQIVAYYLAQDAFETIKNIIDSNKLTGHIYSQGGMIYGDLNSKCVSDYCIIDTFSRDIVKYTNQKIKYNFNTNVYSYTSGAESIYERYFKIKKIEDDGSTIDEVEVSVFIKWNIPFVGEQIYVLKSNITDW